MFLKIAILYYNRYGGRAFCSRGLGGILEPSRYKGENMCLEIAKLY